MRDEDNDNSNNNSNPFIRFKHHVDANIHAGINTITSFSRSPLSPSSQQNPSSPPSNSQPTTRDTTAGTTTTTNYSGDITTTADLTTSMLSPADQHLESRLDLLRQGGATAPEAAVAWRLFVTRSAYSPLRLQLECGGWQPTPAGGEAGEYGGGAGWLDAFEDLMRVSSGLGLLDLRAASREREESGEEGLWHELGWGNGRFGFGGLLLGGFPGLPHHHHHHGMVGFPFPGLREMAWLERMRRQGLTEVLFPVYDPGLGYSSPRTMGEWAERRRAEEQRAREVGRVWEELVGEGRRAVEEARREAEREADAWRDAAQQKGLSFFDGIGEVVRTLGEVLEDIKTLPRAVWEDEKPRGKDDTAKEKRNSAPETENDLYSVVQSAFQESERSLSNFFKSFSDAWRTDSLPEPKPASPPKTETTEVVQDGITKKTTKRDFVDKHGNTHSKTETTWTDKDGRVVMRQVYSSMGRSEHWDKAEEDRTTRRDKETTEELKEQRKEGGWFWK
ncbi:hypothetical protein N657DRAFT_645495 [Parathielavia appendiculata]|uniref:Uncharacterized protein n=1 Tax=Parathielavia appendiculata TaxID=2587402 RepID=A0AAN6U026_9PEZI|nr:hypothetical protein N657DRAFT_645495 [Parathielavia appendiculata]